MTFKTEKTDASESAAAPRLRDWVWDALLLLPLLVTAIWLMITGRGFSTFWGADEHYFHFPLILEFARQWPHFDLNYRWSATTPLLHIVAATFVKLFGAKLGTLRMLNTLVSGLGILMLRRFLLRERGLSPAASTLGAAVLMLSFYFFGFSFRVLTDNLALVFCLLAMMALYRFMSSREPSLRTYIVGCLWPALAVLTRQGCVFLCLPFVACLFLRKDLGLKAIAAALAAFCLALVPLFALFVIWKGFVPTASQGRHTPGLIPFYASSIAMPLCVLGFYTVFFHASEIKAWATGGWRNWSSRKAGIVVGIVSISFVCSIFLTSGREEVYPGVLNTVADRLPRVFGLGAFTWLVLPMGLTIAFFTIFNDRWFRGDDPGKLIGVLTFVAICLVSLSNYVAAQKYYDAPVLVCLLWGLTPAQAEKRPWKFSMWILLLLFCAYQIIRQTSPVYASSL